MIKAKSLDDVRASIKRCEIKNPPFPITMTIDPDPYFGALGSGVMVRFDAKVKDRDGGHEIALQCGRIFYTTESDAYIVREIEAVVKEIFMHEFHECWHMDGIRVHDPHAVHYYAKVVTNAAASTMTTYDVPAMAMITGTNMKFVGMAVATDEEKP